MIYLVRYHADAPPDIAACEDEPPARYAEYRRVSLDEYLDAWWVRDQWQAYEVKQTFPQAQATCTAPLGGERPPVVELEPSRLVRARAGWG